MKAGPARSLTGLATALLLLGAGCTPEPEEPQVFASPFAACDTLPGSATGAPATVSPAAAPSAAAPSQVATAAPGTAGAQLPDLTLPCFDGRRQVALRQLHGPLVVNLWASWCPPCRKELPAFQRLADQGTVPVLGVVTSDLRDSSASLGEDLGVRFPTLFDADGRLMGKLGYTGLPITIFIAADGHATVHTAPALTDESLAELVHQRLESA